MQTATTIQKSELPDGITITTVSASCEIRINSGSYEHAVYSHFMSATVDPEVISPQAAARALMKECKKAVIVAAAPIIKNRDQMIASAFAKLPQELQDQVDQF